MASFKCNHCGNYVIDTEVVCPYCNANNPQYRYKQEEQRPHTIEELQGWYKAKKLPSENVTRFFIGKNIKEPKAFGIYQDGDDFIVYKNKANGQRAIRYQGPDESYAVNEIYLKLKEEILRRKQLNNKSSYQHTGTVSKHQYYNTSKMKKHIRRPRTVGSFLTQYIIFIFCVPMLLLLLLTCVYLGISSMWINSGYYLGQ